jgi:hypothetical protein
MGGGCRELTTDDAERITQEMFRVVASRGQVTRLGNGYLAP